MGVYKQFIEFFCSKFSLFGFSISFWDVIIFSALSACVGYIIGSFFKK